MITQGDNSPVEVSESTLAIDALVASFEGDTEFKHALQTATILIVPSDLGPEHEGPAFPERTRDVFYFMRESLGDRALVEAAVREKDYVEFAFRSDEIILPILYVASSVPMPLAINVLSSYLYDLLRGRRRKEEARVKSEIHFKSRDGSQLSLKYDGPVNAFEKVTLQYLSDLGLSKEEV